MAYRQYGSGNYYRPSFFGGFSFFPPVIKTLLLSNLAVFLLLVLASFYSINGIPIESIFLRVFALNPIGHGFRIWQLVTYLFMHAGFAHIFFNMLALWMFGMELENTWGSRHFTIYYFTCGIGAGLANLLIAPLFTSTAPTVGASGAVYGVLLAFGFMFPDRPIFMFPIFIPIRAKYFVAIYMVIEIISVMNSDNGGVAHFAHLGGAAVGYVMLLIDRQRLPFQNIFKRFRGPTGIRFQNNTIKPNGNGTEDAKFYDIRDYGNQKPKTEQQITQERIDNILDKISRGGYQSLTEDEKRILFDASKKLN